MPSKSWELDPIPTKIFKKIFLVLLQTITVIVNTSLKGGIFALDWKTAIIQPLIKKLRMELVGKCYRPVSTLSLMSKIVEKCALIRFKNHCNVHTMLPQYPSAYHKFHSCETALTKLVNDYCLWALEDQEVTALVAMDLSAAFDTVDHGILLDVLNKQFGVSGTALKWFDSYLCPRDCKVNVNGSYSTSGPLNFNVPQESLARTIFVPCICSFPSM